MRLTTGKLKGRTLLSPTGMAVRPTSDRVRQALFNAMGSRLNLSGMTVLDLFCGTGALGLEALSRGAAKAMFVDLDPRLAQQNATRCDVLADCTFLRGDARYVTPPTTADLIFVDPPYGKGLVTDVLKRADVLGHHGTVWAIEQEEKGPPLPESLCETYRARVLTERRHGGTLIALLVQERCPG